MRSAPNGWLRPATRVLVLFTLVALLWLVTGSSAAQGRMDLGSGALSLVNADEPQPLCRYGVNDLGDISDYPISDLRVGWYWNWGMAQPPPAPPALEYMPAVRLQPSTADGYTITNATPASIAAAAAGNPGRVWIVGNEPDSIFQDNLAPHVYAEAYHDIYAAVKAADPTARVANGGVVQITPARLLYLDKVLQSYRQRYGTAMPVDVWNIHVYIIQEKSCQAFPQDCWGAEMPPGIDWPSGELYTVDDNANLEVFKQMVRDFRVWMARHGYADRPLVLSEFGVQMPDDYGFPPERVNAYMSGTFDFLRTAKGANGYPADGYRLVQQWAWWSLQRPLGDWYLFSNGWLFDNGTPPQRTVFGDNYAAYTEQIPPEVNLFPVWIGTHAPAIYSPSDPVTVTLSARIANDGEVAQSGPFVVRVYLGTPLGASQQIGPDIVIDGLGGCGRSEVVSVTMTNVAPGSHPVYVVVDPDNEVSERDEGDNLLTGVVLVATDRTFLPLVIRRAQ